MCSPVFRESSRPTLRPPRQRRTLNRRTRTPLVALLLLFAALAPSTAAGAEGPLRQLTTFKQATVEADWSFSVEPRLGFNVNVGHVENVTAGTSVDVGIASVFEWQCHTYEWGEACGTNWWYECRPEGVVSPEQTLPPGALSFGAAGGAHLVATFDCYSLGTGEHVPLAVDLTWETTAEPTWASAGHFLDPLPGPPQYLGAFPRRFWLTEAIVGTASLGGNELVNASTNGAVIKGGDVFVCLDCP